MVHMGFVLIIFTRKIPLMSSYDVEKGKGTCNNSEKGHDSNTNRNKSLSKSWAQSSNKSDFGTPLDGEVLSTYVGKSYSYAERENGWRRDCRGQRIIKDIWEQGPCTIVCQGTVDGCGD